MRGEGLGRRVDGCGLSVENTVRNTFSCFILLSLEFSDAKSLHALNTSPPRNTRYVGVVFTLGAQYLPNSNPGLIALTSVRVGKGTFASNCSWVQVHIPTANKEMLICFWGGCFFSAR